MALFLLKLQLILIIIYPNSIIFMLLLFIPSLRKILLVLTTGFVTFWLNWCLIKRICRWWVRTYRTKHLLWGIFVNKVWGLCLFNIKQRLWKIWLFWLWNPNKLIWCICWAKRWCWSAVYWLYSFNCTVFCTCVHYHTLLQWIC